MNYRLLLCPFTPPPQAGRALAGQNSKHPLLKEKIAIMGEADWVNDDRS
jgi:hypothetical protein